MDEIKPDYDPRIGSIVIALERIADTLERLLKISEMSL